MSWPVGPWAAIIVSRRCWVRRVQNSFLRLDSGPGSWPRTRRVMVSRLETHDLDRDPGAHHLGAERPVDGAALGGALTDQGEEPLDADLRLHLLLEEVARAALVGKRVHRDPPAAVLRSDHVVARDGDGVEEDLVELGAARQLPERPDGDARRLHVDDEIGDAAVLRRRRVGAGEADRPAREPREARPDLLPRETVAVALALGPGADGGQVGAGAGLAEELTPDLLGREDLRDEAALLRLGAVPHERRADVVDAHLVDQLGSLRACGLVVVDRLLDRRCARAAVLGRPGEPAPAGAMQTGLPVAEEGRLLLLVRQAGEGLRA